ncbi:Hypothetical predicted protein [Mytilus galloprovincialis]|uniref:Uncharacterized protein n=1 Tax=Mytilus galloprovincialis TaxID=29158 RepID=A0A8B6H808_MYTGA|nr:Hypothetical predicted protein [Mytilus galloprovincialis]
MYKGVSVCHINDLAVDVIAGSKVFRCKFSRIRYTYYLEINCASNTVGKELKISTSNLPSICELDVNGTLANPYKASCVTDISPEECITPLNCSADGFCECESPATQFYNRDNNTCDASRYL